ncbi:MAG: GAF domain-containing protein [Firmicutes bacterium]|nr:GAF domain-containing protein [Bacillota bacterium]
MFIHSENEELRTKINNSFLETLKGYLDSKLPVVTNLANMSAIIFASFQEINWAGFYLFNGQNLYLGPFQGLPACVEIAIGSGVCGTSALKRETIVVKDTHAFTGHIACDSNSLSEIVIPIIKNNALIGVLDIDSPVINRFDEIDKFTFEKAVNLLVDILV